MGRHGARDTWAGRLMVAAVAPLLVAGCTSAGDGSAGPSTTGGTTPASVAPPTSAVAPTTPPPPATSAAPVSRTTAQAAAPCPYLDTGFVQETVGQQVSATLVTTTTPAEGPLPQCDFQRPDGQSMVTIRTVTKTSAVEAQTAALGVAPDGNPVSDVADGGVVQVASGMTTLAVSKGPVVVVVVINQESSLQAKEIAGRVAASV